MKGIFQFDWEDEKVTHVDVIGITNQQCLNSTGYPACTLTHTRVLSLPSYDTVGDKDDDEALATAGARGPTTLSDGSGIASCGATTQGIDADTGDCSCGTSTDTTTFSLDVLVILSHMYCVAASNISVPCGR
jgi:hypothetical protein